MDNVKTFVLLKYEILTSDQNIWNLCDTYPKEVRSKWAWRCAGDVEHLAKGHKEAEEFIRISKLYRDGLATKKELDTTKDVVVATWNKGRQAPNLAAYACGWASLTKDDYKAGTHAIFYSMCANRNNDATDASRKWNLYISWLIEELCDYEKNHCG